VATSISSQRQRHILAVLLAAFSVLALASVASWEPPLPFAAPWTATNACGPVGAALGWGLAWAFGRAAAFGVPVLAAAWAWNRLRGNAPAPLALKSAIGALILFEVCALLGLGGLDRWTWSGSWGLAAAIAVRSALGSVGSWIVVGALFGVTLLAASELGFHWIGRLLKGLTIAPWNSLRAG
jgi:hypothetical protein